jgi:hypothetical protein
MVGAHQCVRPQFQFSRLGKSPGHIFRRGRSPDLPEIYLNPQRVIAIVLAVGGALPLTQCCT